MTFTKFIKLEVPVEYEKGPDGWYAYVRVSYFGGDAGTPAQAIKRLRAEVKRRSDHLKPIVAQRNKMHLEAKAREK